VNATIGFEEPAPPATEEQIRETEQAVGRPLPAELKQLLTEQNGGYLEPNYLDDDVSMRALFSAGATPVEHLREIASVKAAMSPGGDYDYELPGPVIPIGEDEFGNLICLRLDGEDDDGSVWFWDHEVPPGEEAMTRLADDFSAFMQALRPENE
jgi:SMI1 / KNR4 family (SUKH-1)